MLDEAEGAGSARLAGSKTAGGTLAVAASASSVMPEMTLDGARVAARAHPVYQQQL